VFTKRKIRQTSVKSSFIFIACILLAGCASKKNIQNPDENNLTTKGPKIIFLNYILKKHTNNSLKAILHSKTIVDGTLKKTTDFNLKMGDLAFIQLDKESTKVKDLYLSNPLIKDIEYVTQTGELDKKRIELDSTQVSIRMQLDPLTKFISLELFGDPNIQLLKTTL